MANNYWIQIKASNASQNGWYQNDIVNNPHSITIKPNQLGNIYFNNTTPCDIWVQVGNRSNYVNCDVTLTASLPIRNFSDGTSASDMALSNPNQGITFGPNNDHWLGHEWRGVNDTHTWYTTSNMSDYLRIKWTFGLGYKVPTNETTITAAHAKALGEMVGCKKNALSVTAGNSIGPSSNAYSGQSGVSSNNVIYNTAQTAVYNSLTNGTTRCGTLN